LRAWCAPGRLLGARPSRDARSGARDDGRLSVGVLSNIGVISFVALSAYLLLLTGEISFGQQAFFAIGAYAAGIATALWGWPLWRALGWGAASAGVAPCWSACRPCGCTASISRSRRSPSPRWCGCCSSSSAIR
jgi:ABC-type branched-subunit amino acid transport system permease subunit